METKIKQEESSSPETPDTAPFSIEDHGNMISADAEENVNFTADSKNTEASKSVNSSLVAIAMSIIALFVVSSSRGIFSFVLICSIIRLFMAMSTRDRNVIAIKKDHIMFHNSPVLLDEIIFFSEEADQFHICFCPAGKTEKLFSSIDLNQFQDETRVRLIAALRLALENKEEKSRSEMQEIIDKEIAEQSIINEENAASAPATEKAE